MMNIKIYLVVKSIFGDINGFVQKIQSEDNESCRIAVAKMD